MLCRGFWQAWVTTKTVIWLEEAYSPKFCSLKAVTYRTKIYRYNFWMFFKNLFLWKLKSNSIFISLKSSKRVSSSHCKFFVRAEMFNFEQIFWQMGQLHMHNFMKNTTDGSCHPKLACDVPNAKAYGWRNNDEIIRW